MSACEYFYNCLKYWIKRLIDYFAHVKVVKFMIDNKTISCYWQYIYHKVFSPSEPETQKIYIHYASTKREFKTIMIDSINNVKINCETIAEQKNIYESLQNKIMNEITIFCMTITHNDTEIHMLPLIQDYIKFNYDITIRDILVINNVEYDNNDLLHIEYCDNIFLNNYEIKKYVYECLDMSIDKIV